jgi:hypothetical protein
MPFRVHPLRSEQAAKAEAKRGTAAAKMKQAADAEAGALDNIRNERSAVCAKCSERVAKCAMSVHRQHHCGKRIHDRHRFFCCQCGKKGHMTPNSMACEEFSKWTALDWSQRVQQLRDAKQAWISGGWKPLTALKYEVDLDDVEELNDAKFVLDGDTRGSTKVDTFEIDLEAADGQFEEITLKELVGGGALEVSAITKGTKVRKAMALQPKFLLRSVGLVPVATQQELEEELLLLVLADDF